MFENQLNWRDFCKLVRFLPHKHSFAQESCKKFVSSVFIDHSLLMQVFDKKYDYIVKLGEKLASISEKLNLESGLKSNRIPTILSNFEELFCLTAKSKLGNFSHKRAKTICAELLLKLQNTSDEFSVLQLEFDELFQMKGALDDVDFSESRGEIWDKLLIRWNDLMECFFTFQSKRNVVFGFGTGFLGKEMKKHLDEHSNLTLNQQFDRDDLLCDNVFDAVQIDKTNEKIGAPTTTHNCLFRVLVSTVDWV